MGKMSLQNPRLPGGRKGAGQPWGVLLACLCIQCGGERGSQLGVLDRGLASSDDTVLGWLIHSFRNM